jgi:hypothetical protein
MTAQNVCDSLQERVAQNHVGRRKVCFAKSLLKNQTCAKNVISKNELSKRGRSVSPVKEGHIFFI